MRLQLRVHRVERGNIGQHDDRKRPVGPIRVPHHSIPLVEGIASALRGPVSIAMRKARDSPLNGDTARWWRSEERHVGEEVVSTLSTERCAGYSKQKNHY